MLPWEIEKQRILDRHSVYMLERMQLPISDPGYLMWDRIFCDHFASALEKYEQIIYHHSNRDNNGCHNTGEIPRLRIKFAGQTLIAYRFTYAIAAVLPLSSNEIVRHECNNAFCVNPRHLLVGDEKQNFEDYLAEKAYGTRWELLKGYNHKSIIDSGHLYHLGNLYTDLSED